MSLTGFAVGSIEYSLCIFRLLAYFSLSSHKYAHLLSSVTVSDTVCRWFDRVVYLQLQTVSILAFNNPQIHSPAINSLTVFAFGSIKYSLCKFSQFGNVRITFNSYAHLSSPTLYVTVFAVGSIVYVLWSFRQLAHVRLAIHEFTHLPSPDTVTYGVCRWLDRVISLQLYSVW